MADKLDLPKFNSEQEAFNHLSSIGKLTFYGREGYNAEYCVCTLELNGKKYYVDIYRDGRVIVKE